VSSKNQVKFPEHWQHLKSIGVGNFSTQIIHRISNGNLHIWSSRRFRKRHSSEIKASEIDYHKAKKKPFKYWAWKSESLTWWIGFIFTFGSLLFVVGAIPMMFPNPPVARISVINFLGSVCFTLGSYAASLLVLEFKRD
jgi:hypothetical protein